MVTPEKLQISNSKASDILGSGGYLEISVSLERGWILGFVPYFASDFFSPPFNIFFIITCINS